MKSIRPRFRKIRQTSTHAAKVGEILNPQRNLNFLIQADNRQPELLKLSVIVSVATGGIAPPSISDQ